MTTPTLKTTKTRSSGLPCKGVAHKLQHTRLWFRLGLVFTLLMLPAAISMAAGLAVGPEREILLPAFAAHPDRQYYLDLENHRLVGSKETGDLALEPAGPDGPVLMAAGARGIDRQPAGEITGVPAGLTDRKVVSATPGTSYLVLTRSGRLATVRVAELLSGSQVARLYYQVVGDSAAANPGDSGWVAATWGPELTFPASVRLDLEQGTAVTGTAPADLQATAELLEHVGGAGIQEAGVDFSLPTFRPSGWVHRVVPRMGYVYVVKTRSGGYAKVQVKPGALRVALQQGEQTALAPGRTRPEGELEIFSATLVPASRGQGLNVAGGRLVALAEADLSLQQNAANYTFIPLGGAAMVDLGPRFLDRVAEAPEEGWRVTPVAAQSNRTFALRTRTGHYALVYLHYVDKDGSAYLEIAFQGDGSRGFFPLQSPDQPDGAQPTSVNQGSAYDAAAGISTTPSSAPPTGSAEPPKPAFSLAATAGDRAVTLRWGAAPAPAGAEVEGYFVFRGINRDELVPINAQIIRGTEYVDRSRLQNGTTYYYSVQAYLSNAELGAQTAVTAATPGTAGAGAAGSDAGAAPAGGDPAGSGASEPVGSGPREVWLQMGQPAATVNGQSRALPVAPFVRDGRTLVPLRFIAEALGARVQWVAAEQKILLALGPRLVELWLDRTDARVGGDTIGLEVAPTLVDSTTVVPVRFVSEQLGAEVIWRAEEQIIRVIYRP